MAHNQNGPPSWLSKLAAILASLATILAILANANDDVGKAPPPTVAAAPTTAATVTTKVNAAPGDGKPTQTVQVPKVAAQQAAAVTESNLKDETPEVAVQAAPDLLAKQQALARQVKATQAPLPTAGATAGIPGCRTLFVRNQSSRNGVRPQWIVLHYTVSGNRPGWSDVLAIVALFNNSGAQVSAAIVIDGEGNCAYMVPLEAKSWANAAGNSLSVNIEVINSGRESVYLAPAGQAKLLSVERTISARTGIPLRAGSVFPARPGIVQHKDGGLAWGGHVDITPFSIGQQQRLAAAPVRVPITKRERGECRSIAAFRARERQRRHPGGRDPKRTVGGVARFHRERHDIAGKGLKCSHGKVVRK